MGDLERSYYEFLNKIRNTAMSMLFYYIVNLKVSNPNCHST